MSEACDILGGDVDDIEDIIGLEVGSERFNNKV